MSKPKKSTTKAPKPGSIKKELTPLEQQLQRLTPEQKQARVNGLIRVQTPEGLKYVRPQNVHKYQQL